MTARWPWRSAAVIFLLAAAVTSLFIINLCDWIYDCGCRSWWAGAADRCNVHSPDGPHCPWCAAGTRGFAAVYLGILAPQALLSFWPRRWRWQWRLAAALAASPIIGAAIGLIMGWRAGYWE